MDRFVLNQLGCFVVCGKVQGRNKSAQAILRVVVARTFSQWVLCSPFGLGIRTGLVKCSSTAMREFL